MSAATDRIELTVPPAFWRDHDGRELVRWSGTDYVLGTTSAGIKVRLHRADVADLWNDADFYADMGTATFGSEMTGIIVSARATHKRLTKLYGTASLTTWLEEAAELESNMELGQVTP